MASRVGGQGIVGYCCERRGEGLVVLGYPGPVDDATCTVERTAEE